LSFTPRGYDVHVRAKEFHYDVTLEDGGGMIADGTSPLESADDWKPDHYLVAALLRCTLESLEYHAKRAGLESSGRAEGHAVVTRRESDDRYALVEINASLEVAVEPDPGGAAVAELLAKAERDCFVGASLTVPPAYTWTVNGKALSPRAAPS
jgi:organic hydroperoxide reductase OsmC/OhrA